MVAIAGPYPPAPVLILHHDPPSPASAVAVLRLQRLADEGLRVAFEGIDVLGIDAAIPVTLDVLAELEAWRDRAADLGLELRRPSRRPPTARVHLVGTLAESRGLGAAWRLTTYRAYWEDDADLGDPAVLTELATGIGLERPAVTETLADRGRLARLRQRMQLRRSEGIGGVPILEFNGTYVPATMPDHDLRQLAEL